MKTEEELIKRACEISYKHKLSHLSSVLSALPIIKEIYDRKEDNDIFILSQGHAGLALYVVLEAYEGQNAEKLYLEHGIHPNFNPEQGIYCSAGSLGCGITVALGYAMADRDRKVHCLISDGEAWEGSVYEVFRLKEKFDVDNLIVWLNQNGYTCLDEDDDDVTYCVARYLCPDLRTIDTSDIYIKYPFLKGVAGHYYNLTEDDYQAILKYE